MNNTARSDSCWSQPFILSSGERSSGVRDTRPTDLAGGVLDAKTFDAIEADQLFDCVNHADTHVGQSVLYRSLARPPTDAQLVRDKQEALRELESNPGLWAALQHFVKAMVPGEQSLYHLLYGTFIGGTAIDNPRAGRDKMEFNGYGYHQFVDGTDFAVDLVEGANVLPQPQSAYLRNLRDTIRDFGRSHTYALMRGPIYLVEGRFKTQAEKPRYLPAPRFRPSMIKPLPMLFALAAISGILYFFQSMLADLRASYIGYGILLLAVPVFPVVLVAISASDRDSVIYPLRKQFRRSPDLAQALEALGMIDELLSFRCYALASGGKTTLPQILEAIATVSALRRRETRFLPRTIRITCRTMFCSMTPDDCWSSPDRTAAEKRPIARP